MKLLKSLICFSVISVCTISFADVTTPTYIRYGHHPFYIGGLLGYGSTDWSHIVASCDPNSTDTRCEDDVPDSVPTSAGDSGATVGLTMGYEIQPHFAFETSFIRYPTTRITFTNAYNNLPLDSGTPIPAPFDINGNASFDSYTYVYDVIGKFMVGIMDTSIRAFADAGMAVTYRSDPLNTFSRVNPTFGVGLDYVFAEHWMVDGEFQYVAGYAKSNLTPATTYSPFLYSTNLVLAYRF